MKFGIALGRLNPAFFVDCTLEADRLGFESVWLPEHLIFTRQMSRSPHPGETHPPVPPDVPIFDAFAYLSYLAGRTERIRLGTHVYNIGLRHPFVAARAVQTLDIVCGGRLEFGIGASWLEEEWVAAELDFHTRSRRVDEAIEVCKKLWTEETVDHHGEFFDFEGAVFVPKCVQQPWPPILVGGRERGRAPACRAPRRRLDRHVAHLRIGGAFDRPHPRAARRRGPRQRPASSSVSAARSSHRSTSGGGRSSA